MIQLQKVSKHYGNTKAVEEISFEAKEGETIALLGTSGCGKTTTLRMINRLTEATAGDILVDGKNIQSISPEILRRGIGYVLQHNGLFPHYTVAQNIAIVPTLLKWNREKINNRIEELLEKLQIPSKTFAALYPSQMSGGQQQRVGLARALAAFQPVLLMDEPFGALDPVTRAEIRKEFKSLDELKRKTIIIVTHDVQEAFELADRICLMDKGKIVQMGTAADLLFNSKNDFVKAFLKEQRFQLELESTRIKDIWTLLPKAIDGTGEKAFSELDNLWQVLETISTGQSYAERFVAIVREEKRQIDPASLMAAYIQYKNTLKHG